MARKPTLAAVDSRRALPSVTKVLAELSSLPHGLAVEVARSVVDDARARMEGGEPVTEEAVLGDARRRAAEIGRSLLQPVINATGVIVHTNLGRAPLGPAPLAAVAEVASGYSNLEFRLDRGTRGSRQEHAGALLAQACGAEAALVVNNNAAAVLLVLAALARGREVIVSRGELVEIGGGFRVPDVMAESGARLVEVGTTNRTRRADYERALSPETALILRVHASNYRMVGFVESTPVESPGRSRAAGGGRHRLGPARRDDPLAGRAAGLAAGRARRPPVPRGRGGAGHVLGRQAARRAPGRGDRRPGRPGGAVGPPPAGPGRAGRQDGPGRPAVRRPRLPGRRRRRHPAVAHGRHPGAASCGSGPRPWPRRLPAPRWSTPRPSPAAAPSPA